MDRTGCTKSRGVQSVVLGAVLVVAALLWGAGTDGGEAEIGAGVLEIIGGVLLVVGGLLVLAEVRRNRRRTG